MVKGKIVALGIGIIVGFIIITGLILPKMNFELKFLSSPYGYILILLAGLLIAVSGFLPYNWGKILREIALLCIFVLILLVEMNLISSFVKATEISMEKCESYFRPHPSGDIIHDALKYASCILTGYFPAEEGDIGWTVFYLFYIILPFAFIWILLYGLMKSIIAGWFTGINLNVSALFSFIIAMYAARTMFGGFLLDFAGYGAWGLGALFLAVFLTKSIGNIMEKWYEAEKMGEETRKVIESELEREKALATAVMPIINFAKELGKDPQTLEMAKNELGRIKTLPLWNTLSDNDKNTIDWFINQAASATNPMTFKNYVEAIEKYFKKIEKLKLS